MFHYVLTLKEYAMNRNPSVRIDIIRGITTPGEITSSNAEAIRTATPHKETRIKPARRKSISFLDVATCALRTTLITSKLAPTKAKPNRKYNNKKYGLIFNSPF